MLPNHAPLVVAERFKMLEALFPGRIDLGLGRAPGTDGATAHALRSRLDRREGDDFLERLHELTLWETRDFPPGHPYNNVVAMPDDTPLPPIWLLGSSDYSSELAAQVGMGFAFAHHFASYDAIEAMTQLPRAFQAVRLARDAARHSRGRRGRRRNRCGSRTAGLLDGSQPPAPRPRPVLCRCRASRKRWPIPTPTSERASIARNRSRLFVGSPATLMGKLQPMIAASQADELMIITAVYDHDARKKSYSLLAGRVRARDEAKRPTPESRSRFTRRDTLLLAERRAEGMAGIDADDAEFAREELQFLQREGEALSSGWPSTSA